MDLLQVLSIGGPVALAAVLIAWGIWLASRHAIERWLDTKFGERLQNLKTAHDKELKRLQSRIDRELDRAKLLHNKEFAVLQEVWDSMYSCYWKAREATYAQQQMHNFLVMSDAQAAHVIETLDIEEWEKQALRELETPAERHAYYPRAQIRARYLKAEQARRDCLNLVEKSSLYLQPAIRSSLLALNHLAKHALEEAVSRLDTQDPAVRYRVERSEALQREGASLLQGLELKIHARLWETAIVEPPATEQHA